jgi:hypothetical protein
MRYENRTLLLEELAPATIVLSEVTAGRVSHLHTSAFLDAWWEAHRGSADASSSASAQAVLTLLDGGARQAGDVVLSVQEPRISGAGLRWTVDVIEGVLPSTSGSCLLCVDCPPRAVEPIASDPR